MKSIVINKSVSQVVEILRNFLTERGIVYSENAVQYGTKLNIVEGKKNSSVVVYGSPVNNSAKLVFEAGDDALQKIIESAVAGMCDEFPPEVWAGFPANVWAGTDESGKGDFFGPLVVAGVCTDKINAIKLRGLGVRDSKMLSDKSVGDLRKEIIRVCDYTVVVINPEKYNQLYQEFKNLNKLLAWAHARAIENLLEKREFSVVIVDKFAKEGVLAEALMSKGKRIRVIQVTGAEKDIAVASASILARAEFNKRIEELSEKAGVKLPKGASDSVKNARYEIVKRDGAESLSMIAKTHFKM